MDRLRVESRHTPFSANTGAPDRYPNECFSGPPRCGKTHAMMERLSIYPRVVVVDPVNTIDYHGSITPEEALRQVGVWASNRFDGGRLVVDASGLMRERRLGEFVEAIYASLVEVCSVGSDLGPDLAPRGASRCVLALDEVQAVWLSESSTKEGNRRAFRQMVQASKVSAHTGVAAWVASQGPLPGRSSMFLDRTFVFGYEEQKDLHGWRNSHGSEFHAAVRWVEDVRRPERGFRPVAVKRSKNLQRYSPADNCYTEEVCVSWVSSCGTVKVFEAAV